ncbi:MAG: PilN domain-containing protein [Oscillatoria sp. PMC 1068.18]|nr:PilN domain-containing protein [Oscillatoria sp. PMC 1076.18]MEC4988204.1 PilN domain-containing protein [Oscillatoria sp. PMC 1068.18]
MYSLDVNFLKDRPDLNPEKPKAGKRQKFDMGEKGPLLAGIAALLLLPAFVGGVWYILTAQTEEINEDIAELDKEIEQLNAQVQAVDALKAQIEQVNAEVNSLASVFYQIKPWSAILQDIRDRIPPGVQISSIEQSEVEGSSSASSSDEEGETVTTSVPIIQLTIQGAATSFNQVNDFLLTLQQSDLLANEETRLVSAQLTNNPAQLVIPDDQQAENVTVELPQVVEYTISTELTNKPASELIRQLDSKGATGLVTRLRTLQQQGVGE